MSEDSTICDSPEFMRLVDMSGSHSICCNPDCEFKSDHEYFTIFDGEEWKTKIVRHICGNVNCKDSVPYEEAFILYEFSTDMWRLLRSDCFQIRFLEIVESHYSKRELTKRTMWEDYANDDDLEHLKSNRNALGFARFILYTVIRVEGLGERLDELLEEYNIE